MICFVKVDFARVSSLYLYKACVDALSRAIWDQIKFEDVELSVFLIEDSHKGGERRSLLRESSLDQIVQDTTL